MRILLIEDDAQTASYVCAGLRGSGHQCAWAADGPDGLAQAEADGCDLLIVDRMLPGLDGLAVVKTLRAARFEAPVLFLTALGGIDDRVAGLRAGGDDYLVKPFAFAELTARVEALGRRPRMAPQTVLIAADVELDLLGRIARRGGEVLDVQPREFRILEYLMRHADQVVTRRMLLEDVWNIHFDPQTNLVESHISRLRGKLEAGGRGPELIQTVRHAGYRFSTQG